MLTRFQYATVALASSFTVGTVCSGSAVVFPVSEGGTGNTYEILLDTDASFEAARDAAESAGGHLLSITTPEEQAFVEGLLMDSNAPTGSYWLGLEMAGGEFAWETGEAFDYSNFATLEPNEFLDMEDAAQVYWTQDLVDDVLGRRGEWNDAAKTGYPSDVNESFPTPDLTRAGFIIERNGVGAGEPGGESPTVAIPLPAALFAAPLTALLAGAAMRRMRRAAR